MMIKSSLYYYPPLYLSVDGSCRAPPPLLPVSPLNEAPEYPVKGLSNLLCHNCSRTGHLKRNCPSIKCHECGHEGHFKEDCPQKRSRHHDDIEAIDGKWEVCNACGSPQHMMSSCPIRYQKMECFQCHQVGHGTVTCPFTRCFNCGTYGHSSQICHSKPYCFHCAHQGHRSLDCPLRPKGRVCYQCNAPGHEAADCPQGQLCRMCHRPGHLIAHCPKVVCHSCHEKGHTSSVCVKVHCEKCGGQHETVSCRQVVKEEEEEEAEGADRDGSSAPPTVASPHDLEDTMSVPPYVPSGAPAKGRVVIVIDGPYFERSISRKDLPKTSALYHTTTADALRYTLQYIGDIFRMEPVAFWFDTDPAAFSEFVQTVMPLAHRASHLQAAELRKKYLTDEMNGGGALNNVIAKLVGGMKQQRGYTRDGPGHVWVQSGVDVAIATCLIEQYRSPQFQQVVLVGGDADLYPSVRFCNSTRTSPVSKEEERQPLPVRVCGTDASISKIYGQEQHISDFLPKILLDKPSHTEGDHTVEFPTHTIFC